MIFHKIFKNETCQLILFYFHIHRCLASQVPSFISRPRQTNFDFNKLQKNINRLSSIPRRKIHKPMIKFTVLLICIKGTKCGERRLNLHA